MPVIQKQAGVVDQQLPDWLRPENASVFDPAWEPPVRKAVAILRGLIGADDPTGQVMGVASALDLPAKEAPAVLAALAEKFPHVKEAILGGKMGPKGIAQEMRAGLGSLAKTVAPGGAGDPYSLRASVLARLGHFFERGAEPAATANWEGVVKELTGAFGGDVNAARTYAREWGAVSPGTSVPRSTGESVSAWLHALQTGGKPMTVEEARTMTPKITMAGSKVPNINRALLGEPLSGDKVEAMAGFMVGDPRVPIDVHALYGLGSTAEKLDTEIPALRALMTSREGVPARGGLTNTQIYTRYEQAIKDALQEFDPKRDVNGIFAQTWEGIRAAKGLKPQGGPMDILRKKGLLEYGAMLEPARLIEALKTKGWTAGAIAGLIAMLPKPQPDVPPPAAAAGGQTTSGPPAPAPSLGE